MCLQEEVQVTSFSHPAVDNGPNHRVASSVSFFLLRSVGMSVMTLPDDDDSDAWLAGLGELRLACLAR